jgi:uroporphyrinogen III methyltransferase/synthase
MTTGRVHLVGAGPGDPGLLTLRGQRCLAEADVVVHDHLVPRRLLEHVRPGAEVIAIGRPHDDPSRLAQSAVAELLIDRARKGRDVVRLKNGDPFVFGRGAEEIDALVAAGVPFDVVPGVTSAVAVPAYAGIPVTHRVHASLVTIVTGHQACLASGADPPPLPWRALVEQGGTLVFLMAARRLPAILEALQRHGLSPDTPAAVVRHGTLGSQQTIEATAGTLAARAGEVKPPAVLIVGEVVRARAGAAWFEQRPLLGRRIVVTRPRGQAGELARLFEEHGAEVVLFPTIAIGPPPDAEALDRAVRTVGSYDWCIFTSANGVRVFFERLAALRCDVRELAGVRLAAIGPETAGALERLMLRPAIVPAEYRAEGLLEAFAGVELAGRRVLLPRAAGARAVLPETLAARGAHVDEVIAYAAVPPPDADVEGMRNALHAGAIDVLTFTSSSTVERFVELIGADVLARGPRPLVACIGPITAATAAALRLPADVQPDDYTASALAAAVRDHFCKAAADRITGAG